MIKDFNSRLDKVKSNFSKYELPENIKLLMNNFKSDLFDIATTIMKDCPVSNFVIKTESESIKIEVPGVGSISDKETITIRLKFNYPPKINELYLEVICGAPSGNFSIKEDKNFNNIANLYQVTGYVLSRYKEFSDKILKLDWNKYFNELMR